MLHPQEEAKTADKHFLQHDKFKDLAKKNYIQFMEMYMCICTNYPSIHPNI